MSIDTVSTTVPKPDHESPWDFRADNWHDAKLLAALEFGDDPNLHIQRLGGDVFQAAVFMDELENN